MVYCGKPSKGCSNCRERKIRCDQREPGCGQCEKRQQRCPGYRNLVDLMFRDESSHVIKKAKARARKRANVAGASPPTTPSDSEGRLSATPEPRSRQLSLIVPPTPVRSGSAGRDVENPDDSSMLMSPESGSWPVTPPMAQLYNIPPTCQEDGFAYFFSRYVTADEMVFCQKFDFLRDVWKPSPDAHKDGVLASMTAVGLMGLASTKQSPGLMDAARKSYGTALRLTNHALRDSAEAIKDSTMLSVLILGVFEIMAENNQRTTTCQAFQGHVKGAAALARMRGPAQFRTEAGRRMFLMLCERATVSCAQRNEPMPEFLMELGHEMKTAESEKPSSRLMAFKWQVLQLRYEMKNGFLSDPAMIVDRLLSIDEEFEKFIAQLPPTWKYRVLKVKQDHPAVYGGICHRYTSIHHANVWNHIRTTRILVLETILAEISRDLTGFSPTLDPTQYIDTYHKARRKLKHIVREVAASIPQQLGLMRSADGTIGRDDDDDSAPIATVEIVATPSPPVSPSARSSDSVASATSSDSCGMFLSGPGGLCANAPASAADPRQQRTLSGGPTIINIVRGRDTEEEAERYMLLVSATSTVVWPLFIAGMSTACPTDVSVYIIDRLRTLYMQTGSRQADAVANMLEERDIVASATATPASLAEVPLAGVVSAAAAGVVGDEGPWVDVAGLRDTGHNEEVAAAAAAAAAVAAGPGMGEGYDGMGLVPLMSPGVVTKSELDLVWV
ncbi:hypothetical protein VTI28DRAFT_5408 [Corynascus sepedonium]